jgi:hypothetical protein
MRPVKRSLALTALLVCACSSGPKRFDFSEGGSELELLCMQESGYIALDPTRVQATLAGALPAAVFETADLLRPASDGPTQVHVTMVRSTLVARTDAKTKDKARDVLVTTFADRQIVKASWSGDRLFVRSRLPIAWRDAATVLASAGLELRPWTATDTESFGQPDDATGEYRAGFSMAGLDSQLQKLVEDAFDVSCQVLRFETVGPQRR